MKKKIILLLSGPSLVKENVREWLKKEQLKNIGNDNFPLENFFMFYCNLFVFLGFVFLFLFCCFLQKKIVFTGGFF